MEYVSMLAGHDFTDAPLCTDPLLAELARLVNDNIGEHARDSLTCLADRLAALPPRAGRTVAPAIVVAALDAVLRVHPRRRDLLRHRRRALRWAAPTAIFGMVSPPRQLENPGCALYRRGPARRALSRAVLVAAEHGGTGPECDTVLATMLRDAITVADREASRGSWPDGSGG
jgi:hypothetical protein